MGVDRDTLEWLRRNRGWKGARGSSHLVSLRENASQFLQYNLQSYPDAVRGLSNSGHQSAEPGSGSRQYLQISTGGETVGEPSVLPGGV